MYRLIYGIGICVGLAFLLGYMIRPAIQEYFIGIALEAGRVCGRTYDPDSSPDAFNSCLEEKNRNINAGLRAAATQAAKADRAERRKSP
jgi:hypothetical protein